MRLLSLELTGFRGFSSKQHFDLSADALIVVGTNGNGKTSIFDAILWAISGRVPRLGIDDSLLTCRFSESGQMRVSVRLGDRGGASSLTVTRFFDGETTKLTIETSDGIFRGPEAEGRLIQCIWQEAATAASPQESLAVALTRSVYLQQDLVRDFIDSVKPSERFAAVSELVGAGRVTDLQSELEKAKRAWSHASNNKSAELQPLRNRLTTMQSRLAQLIGHPTTQDNVLGEKEWTEWWNVARKIGVRVTEVSMLSGDAGGAIDLALRELDSIRQGAERRKTVLDTLIQELRGLEGKQKPDLISLRAEVASIQQRLKGTRSQIATENVRLADVRRTQTELREASEQLRVLAVLALKQLGEKCPVCEQTYDVDATRRRLTDLATKGNISEAVSPPEEVMPKLLELQATDEIRLATTEQAIRQGLNTARDIEAIEQRLKEVGIDSEGSENWLPLVTAQLTFVSERITSLVAARRDGEGFALSLSQSANIAAVAELKKEIQLTQARLQQEEAELSQRAYTGQQAQRLLEVLREAASRVVTERIEEIGPLLSDIYGRIDIHPAFRAVRFLTSIVRGKGQLSAIVSDPLSEVKGDAPATVLSSSQMNALAVCTFLSLNLGVSHPPLESAILDDPLQSLDDINLLGLIDLLRRTKDRRQLFVSTHDLRFGNLLAHKLRPGSGEQRTVLIELSDWKRTGPTATIRDIPSDPVPIRLLAAG